MGKGFTRRRTLLPFVQRCTVSYKGCARRIERWTNEDEAMKHEWEREREGKNSTVEGRAARCACARAKEK